jgi:hypothetical protein
MAMYDYSQLEILALDCIDGNGPHIATSISRCVNTGIPQQMIEATIRYYGHTGHTSYTDSESDTEDNANALDSFDKSYKRFFASEMAHTAARTLAITSFAGEDLLDPVMTCIKHDISKTIIKQIAIDYLTHPRSLSRKDWKDILYKVSHVLKQ